MSDGAFVEAGHLGGYREGGDEATYYPGLWDWLVTRDYASRVLDVGCGEGHSLRFFRDRGAYVLGIDGVEQDDPDIYTHDYTLGPLPDDLLSHTFSLGWVCEFVEHVADRFVPNLLSTFAVCDVVLLTHAFPGQEGYHHVNLQTSQYWIGVLAAAGHRYDPDLTDETRTFARLNPNPWNHYARSGLAFRRT